MKKNVLLLLFILLTVTCASKKIAKVYWQGDLIEKTEDINYLYWKDGNQFISQQDDSVTVSYTGFGISRTIFILVSIANNRMHPFTFYLKNCQLIIESDLGNIVLQPVRNKNLDKSHFSLFNSIIRGAGSITRLFISIPINELIKTGSKDRSAMTDIGEEYSEDQKKITKKIFMSNHTIFPSANYLGFIVFEFEKGHFLVNKDFTVNIKIDNLEFSATGQLLY